MWNGAQIVVACYYRSRFIAVNACTSFFKKFIISDPSFYLKKLENQGKLNLKPIQGNDKWR